MIPALMVHCVNNEHIKLCYFERISSLSVCCSVVVITSALNTRQTEVRVLAGDRTIFSHSTLYHAFTPCYSDFVPLIKRNITVILC